MSNSLARYPRVEGFDVVTDVVGLIFPWVVLAPPILAIAARHMGSRSQSRTFHAQIAANRANSLTAIAATVSVVVLVWFLIAAFFGAAAEVAMGVGLGAGLATILVAALGYRFGDRFVLAALHAREVEPDPVDPREQELLDVVREMVIAANLPMPRIHVVDADNRPNSFATGRNPDHASIAVTRGLLEKMDREQLQGIVAHEVAHIRNHDARLNLVLAVLGG